MKYRKKPVVIDAYQATEEMKIDTLEGVMTASPGDYIITGVKGEVYPCKPDIFEMTYEAVEESEEQVDAPKWVFERPSDEELADGQLVYAVRAVKSGPTYPPTFKFPELVFGNFLKRNWGIQGFTAYLKW